MSGQWRAIHTVRSAAFLAAISGAAIVVYRLAQLAMAVAS